MPDEGTATPDAPAAPAAAPVVDLSKPAEGSPTPAAKEIDLSAQDPAHNGSAWLQDMGFTDEQKSDGTFTKYTSKEAFYKGVKDMAVAYRARQESNPVLPTNESTAEEIAKWREYTGAPKDLAGYEVPESIKSMEADRLKGLFGENGFDNVMTMFDKLGLSQHQANTLTDGYLGLIDQMGDSFELETVALKTAANEKAMEDLKIDWGDNYDANINVYSSFVGQFEGLREMLLEEGINNSPVLIRAFTKMAEGLGEASIEGTTKGGYGRSYDDQINDLNARKSANSINSSDFTKEWNAIHERAFGKADK